MVDYFSADTIPTIAIPDTPDPVLLAATLERLATSDPYQGLPRFANDASAAAAIANATTKAMFERIRDLVQMNATLQLELLRRIPEQHWPVTNEYRAATLAIALVRGIADTRLAGKPLNLNDELVPLTDEELRTLLELARTDTVAEVSLSSDEVVARVVAIATDEQLVAVWSKIKHQGRWRLLRALAPASFTHLFTHAPRASYGDALFTFEGLRRGVLDAQGLASELAAARSTYPYALLQLFQPPPHTTSSPEWTTEQIVTGIADAQRHAASLREPLRAVLDAERARASTPEQLRERGLLFLFAVCYDEELGSWFTTLCESNAAWFRKKQSYPAVIFETLGDVLAARDDGDDIVAALAKRLKGKTFAELFAQTSARLANNRTMLQPTGQMQIQWGRTKTDDAERMLRSCGDPRPVVEAGIASDDPVAVLNAVVTAFVVSARYVDNQKPDERKARELWSWDFLERALRALERSYTPRAPDGATLAKRIGGHHSASYRIEPALRWLFWLDAGDKDARETFVDSVLVPLYTSTNNVKFRRWIEPIVTNVRPALAETTRDRLVRLAALTTSEGGETATRAFVFRTRNRPTKDTVNRLYGPPVGVTDKTWPTHRKKKMQHVITLETRLLASEQAAVYAARGTTAIAVFVSSLDKHEAFAPGNKHAAVVELTAADVARGADVVAGDDDVAAGIALDAVTCVLPVAAFKGGTKEGALWELRRVLDQTDFLTPDRVSPSWIQDPQPAGTFLFELDEAFAGELNLGDAGRFYVFDATAFMQCH